MARIAILFANVQRHLRHDTMVASLTVGTVAIVFLVLTEVILLGVNLDRLADQLQAGFQVAVYLRDDATDEQRSAIQVALEAAPELGPARFYTREEALARFRARLRDGAGLLEGLEENPLPASFEAPLERALLDAAKVSELVRGLEALPGVEEVQYGQAWLERFFDFMRIVRMGGLAIGALIVFATLIIVSNTIRLSVVHRRDEILILKLVGATDWFVKLPFYVEGSLLASVGASLGVAAAWVLFGLVPADFRIPLGPDSLFELCFLPPDWTGLLIAAGGGLGLLATLSSLWRHLRI